MIRVLEHEIRRRMRRKQRRVNWLRLGLWVAAVMFLVGLIAGSGFYSFYSFLDRLSPVDDTGSPEESPVALPGEPVNVLFLGVDSPVDARGKPTHADFRKAYTRTDTMILISYDPLAERVSLISIPRDTEVTIPGHGKEKAAHAHAYGGPQLAMKTIGDFLGIPIHYYVRTNFEGFVRVVDILGGVEFNVPQDMFYVDPEQDLRIDLKKGPQLLDGEKALQLVRFRMYWDGDVGRVRTQQAFMGALMKKIYQVGTIFKLPGIAREVLAYVDTNMDPDEIIRFATAAKNVQRENIKMAVLPGELRDGSSYYYANGSAVKRLLDELVLGIDRQANGKVRLEVLNGTATSGLAAKVADRLREQGYNVVRVGNADNPNLRYTKVINRSGDDPAADSVARALRRLASSIRLSRSVVDQSDVDVTVIVGPDLGDV